MVISIQNKLFATNKFKHKVPQQKNYQKWIKFLWYQTILGMRQVHIGYAKFPASRDPERPLRHRQINDAFCIIFT